MKCVQCWDKDSYFRYTDDDRRMSYRRTNEYNDKKQDPTDPRCHDSRVSTSCNGKFTNFKPFVEIFSFLSSILRSKLLDTLVKNLTKIDE